jgi:hypothetical protein
MLLNFATMQSQNVLDCVGAFFECTVWQEAIREGIILNRNGLLIVRISSSAHKQDLKMVINDKIIGIRIRQIVPSKTISSCYI